MKKIVIFMCSLLLTFSMATVASASTGTIRVGSATVTEGDEFRVSISVTGSEGIGVAEVFLKYDPSILEYKGGAQSGGGGRLNFLSYGDDSTKSYKYTVTFKAKKAGTSSLSLNGSNLYNANPDSGDYMNTKVSNGSVTVKPPKTYSSDATLSSLRVSGQTLSPAFSKNVTSYSVTVPNSVTSLTVSAKANHSQAKVFVNGTKNLRVGTNTVSIQVTAENGSKKTYTIRVTRQSAPSVTKEPVATKAPTATKAPEATEKPEATKTPEPTQTPEATQTPEPTITPTVEPTKAPISVTVGTKDLTIMEELPTDLVADSYKETIYNYKDKEVKALKDANSGRVLFYLSDEKFYLYDEKNDTFMSYQPFTLGKAEYVILEADEEKMIPESYKKSLVDISGKKVELYKASEESPFYLFYGSNQKGQEALYCYDAEQATIQRYHNINDNVDTTDMDKALGEAIQLKEKLSVYQTVLAAIGGFSIIGIIATIIMKIRKRKMDK